MAIKIVFAAGIVFVWAYGMAYASYRGENCRYDAGEGQNRLTLAPDDPLYYVFLPAGIVDRMLTGMRYEKVRKPALTV